MSPEDFIARWREPLEARAQVLFAHEERSIKGGNHCEIADDFVKRQGLHPIGFNWELLDSRSPPGEPRSARGVIAGAFARDMALPQTQWLGPERAEQCAEDFMDLFDARSCTIVSNRLENLWNPLTRARIEWGFIGFDEVHKVFLLVHTGY